MRTEKLKHFCARLCPTVLAVGLLCISTAAQTPPAARPAAPERRQPATSTAASHIIVENKPAAPQVVTILHSLNGLKVIRLLINKERAEVIAKLDEAFNLAGEVHTNVIAGLALDDGVTIAAWLPEAEAEMPPPQLFAPRVPQAPQPSKANDPGRKAVAAPVAVFPPLPRSSTPGGNPPDGWESLFEAADLRIITREGKRIQGRYLGLDGLTGLSLITITNGSLPVTDTTKEGPIEVGQRLRVIGPEPAPGPEMGAGSRMYIRIGETEAVVVEVIRSPSGAVARLRVKSTKFSPTNIGGIAINDRNEALGIVDTVQSGEATIIPMSLVRVAAKRVIARQASVPRPWLGIRGEPIYNLSLEQIQHIGWQMERARALTQNRKGILLTQVAPNSPAAHAKLKPGDVILSVNHDDIRDAAEFSWLLDEADPESPVLFTVARPEKEESEAMEIQLSESPDPFLGRRKVQRYTSKTVVLNSLLTKGVETVALKPAVASRFGSKGGLLVVSVRPATDAFKAGLRAGDVIESIDGQPAYSVTPRGKLHLTPGARSTCVVVRNKERLTLSLAYTTDDDDSDNP